MNYADAADTFLKLDGWEPWIRVFTSTPEASDHQYASVLLRSPVGSKTETAKHMLIYYHPPEGHTLLIRGINPSIEEVFCIAGGYVSGKGVRMMSPGDFVRHSVGVDHAGFALPGTLLFVRYDDGVDTILTMKLASGK
ncbi:MAG: hypothetical protein EPN41_02820 [Candidimonas sp.]|nr:MAG: hypothetical protein EPN41_02820 [Candidimonas sp.]